MTIFLLASLLYPLPSAHAGTLYSFSSAGASGSSGPTQVQIDSSYSGTPLQGLVTINTEGIQEWTVPTSGEYWLEIAGASGGYTPNAIGGRGRVIKTKVVLTAGHLLKILVGQEGGRLYFSTGYAGGGGGGTFIFNSNTSSFIGVAGGGGGAGQGNSSYVSTQPGVDAPTYSSTSGGAGTSYSGSWSAGQAGGTSGAAGAASSGGGSGAGINANGSAGSFAGGGGGFRFANGGTGGTNRIQNASATTNVAGGFGGGAGAGIYANYDMVGGGGGGYSGGGGSGTRVGAGGGGGNFFTGTYVSDRLNTGNGFVSIEAVGPSLNTFAPRTTLTNQTSITYDIVFSENVTDFTAGDLSKSGTGSSSCTIGTPSGSGTTYAVQLTGCSEGTIVLTIAANAAQNSIPQFAPASNTAAATVTIDQTAPTISTVTAPANRTYIPSETPTFTVAFSESVTVAGTPRLTLTVGSTTEYASYLSMTDSRTALFRYTVASDPLEFDIDGMTLATSLDLNSGTIRDLATNSLSNTSLTAPALTSVLVAQPPAAPTIDSITATSGTLTVYFTAGTARGSTTSNYQFSTNNGGAWGDRSPVATTSPLVISGLNNGQGYQVRLRAISDAGTSDSSTVVTETPTAVSVTGDSALILTYGSSASTSAYSATGGTNTYTWSLGSTLTGITLSGTTVTASSATPAGTYSQIVRATDGNNQVGTKSLTITVNKASTSITIALPNSATSTALGGAVTITATVPRAGVVNFRLGGSSISGCGSASAATTTATCSWTPASLGSISLTAIFTPTDTSNFETSTSTTLSISVVNGVTTVTLSLAGGVTTAPKGQAINIIAAVDQAGRITFFVDGKRVPRCINRAASVGNVTCSWKPAVQKAVTISARLTPTNNVYNASSSSMNVAVVRRSGTR